MSCYVIYYENGAKMMRPVLSESEYRALRGTDRQKLNRMTGNKTKLVQMNYSCRPTPQPSLRTPSIPRTAGAEYMEGEGVVTNCGPLKGCTTPSNSVGMDVDFDPNDPDYEQKMKAVPELVLGKKDELGLLMLERSVRKGYHIVFRRRPELSQEENLRWASELLGVQYDEGAKDITRVFFTTTDSEEDLLFVDQKLFSSEECSLVRSEELLRDAPREQARRGVRSNLPLTSSLTEVQTYQGVEYAQIVKKYLEMFNDGKEPCEGNRNVLTFELAMLLRGICGFSQEKLEQIIPNYWGEGNRAEYSLTIANALKEPHKGLPMRLRQVLAALKEVRVLTATGGTRSTPPPMPAKLPPLIKLLTKNVPARYKPAVASAVFPALGVHMHGVKFRYWDNVLHEPTFMHVLVGRQSVGKGCIKQPIEYIMADIRQRDEPNRRREAEWKRQNPSGKSKAKDPRPQDICIQMLIDNLTDAVFNQRIVDANANGERFVYTLVDEVEGLKKVTSSGRIDEVTLLIRKAFDNALAGQERVGADSVSGIAPLRWNWNASTTPPNARRFFRNAVNDGTISRLDMATIGAIQPDENHPERAEDVAPIFGIYNEDFTQELKPYLERLGVASGLVECPAATKLALKMRVENDDLADQMDSEAFRILSYRANVIAWLKGMLLYVAHGYTWSKEIADFVHWSEQYNLWCKMLYFGTQLEAELAEEKEIENHSGPQNLLCLLPAEFSKEDYLQLRGQLGKTGDGASTLRSWLARGYICWDDMVGKYVNKKSRQ